MSEVAETISAADLEAGLWPIAKAASRLGVTARTARRWVKDGEFPVRVFTMGGRFRVSVVELEEWLAASKAAS